MKNERPPSDPAMRKEFERGIRVGLRRAVQSVASIMNEEAREFGMINEPEFQSMRARVRNRLRRHLLETGVTEEG